MKTTLVHTSRVEQLFFHSQPIKFLVCGVAALTEVQKGRN